VKELEKLGECLLRLRVKAVHTGLGGRFIIKLERGKHYKEESPPLPAHRFTPGNYPKDFNNFVKCDEL